MESLWGVGPEVPSRVGVLSASVGAALLGMDEVWELDWVSDKEDWSIVSNHIPVTFLGVMLDSETTWVAIAIVGTALTSDSGETKEDGSSLSNGVHELGLAEAIRQNIERVRSQPFIWLNIFCFLMQ